MDFRVAAKAFIVDKDKLLLIKRRPNDVHKPGLWDIPGGRLDMGESPYEGLLRETKEEIGIDIEILAPLHVQHFTRDDGQGITMLIFVCRPKSKAIRLSKEHTEYKWQKLGEDNDIPSWLGVPVSNFRKYYKGRI
jgi:8-oxo-dGTP diphosphatase